MIDSFIDTPAKPSDPTMKPPTRPRAKPTRFTVVPAGTGPTPDTPERRRRRVLHEWTPAQRQRLLNALKAQGRTSNGGFAPLDLTALETRMKKTPVDEIQCMVEALQNKVLSHVSICLRKEIQEEWRLDTPIELWVEQACRVTGALEEPILTAFSQMFTISSMEPYSQRSTHPTHVPLITTVPPPCSPAPHPLTSSPAPHPLTSTAPPPRSPAPLPLTSPAPHPLTSTVPPPQSPAPHPLTSTVPPPQSPAPHPLTSTVPPPQSPAPHPLTSTVPPPQSPAPHPLTSTVPPPQSPAPHPLTSTEPPPQRPAPHPLTSTEPPPQSPAPHPLTSTEPPPQRPAPHPLTSTEPPPQRPAPHPLTSTVPPPQSPAPHPLTSTEPPPQRPAPHPLTSTEPPPQSPAPHPLTSPASHPLTSTSSPLRSLAGGRTVNTLTPRRSDSPGQQSSCAASPALVLTPQTTGTPEPSHSTTQGTPGPPQTTAQRTPIPPQTTAQGTPVPPQTTAQRTPGPPQTTAQRTPVPPQTTAQRTPGPPQTTGTPEPSHSTTQGTPVPPQTLQSQTPMGGPLNQTTGSSRLRSHQARRCHDVDFSKIYRYLGEVDSEIKDRCVLTAMESAVVLELLMCLPEELHLLDGSELHRHFMEVYEVLSSPASSVQISVKAERSRRPAAPSGGQQTTHSGQATDSKGRDQDMMSSSSTTTPTCLSSSTQTESTNRGPSDWERAGLCPLNPFRVPLKLLARHTETH